MTTGKAWRDLRLRVISAAILTPLALLAIWFGGLPWKIWLALGVVGLGAEWAKLIRIDPRLLGVLLPLIIVTQEATARTPADGLFLGVIFALLAALVSRRIILGVGFLYIWPAYVSLLAMRSSSDGFRNVLFLLVVVWSTDIGAYLMGRLIGGARLAPWISPGKTWSGALGGLVAAAFCGAAAGYEHPIPAVVLAMVLSFVSQLGDLLESAIKRHFGVKDSGTTIPGHGGLLDRLDGILTAAPAAMLWSVLGTPHAMLWAWSP